MRTLFLRAAAVATFTAPAVLTLLAVRDAAAQEAAAPVAREQTADQQVRHVLNRLAFGARPGDIDKVRGLGVDAWIELQLNPSRISDPVTAQFLTQLAAYTASSADLMASYPQVNAGAQLARARTAADSAEVRQMNGEARRMVADLQAARVGRAVSSERQLEEVLVDFWLNHFSVFSGKAPQQMRYHLAEYEREVIRPHVLGTFRDMLGAVAMSPAMLIYLDNRQSQADTGRVTLGAPGGAGRGGVAGRMGRGGVGRGATRPPQPQRRASGLNENYARELLELHTLGVDGGYTQRDVGEVARAFTGWTVVPPNDRGRANGRGAAAMGVVTDGHFRFIPQVHDAEPKTVLGVRMRAGRGIEDGQQVLDIVARHPSTATFVATKLARRLVSDDPPAALVARAAETFRRTDGDLREVVRTIVTSPEFFSSAVYRAKVKTPFEVVVSAMRAVGAPPDPTPRTAQFVAQLGQPVFGRATPDGWPETGDAWINTGSILNRINFGITLAAGRVPGTNPQRWPLPVGIRSESRERQVDAVIAAFLGGEASPETRQVLIAGVNPLLDVSADTADTSGTQMSVRPPPVTGGDMDDMRMDGRGRGGALARLPALEGLPQIVGLALGSPEFQRR